MILMEMTLEYELEEYDEKEKEKVDPLINIIQWKQWNTCKHSKIEKVKCLKKSRHTTSHSTTSSITKSCMVDGSACQFCSFLDWHVKTIPNR